MAGFSSILKNLLHAGYIACVKANRPFLNTNHDLRTLMKPNKYYKRHQVTTGSQQVKYVVVLYSS